MEEQIAQLVFKFNELEKLVNYNLQYLLLTWAILAVIVAVLAFAGIGLINKWVNDRVSKELGPMKDELKELQNTNRQLASDYKQIQEFGEWTPYLEKGSHHYLKQNGKYSKIGNIISLWVDLQIVGKDETIDGNIAISGLPFVSTESIECDLNLVGYKSVDSKGEIIKLSGFIPTNRATLYLTELDNGLSSKNLTYQSIGNITKITGSIIYRIN